MQRVVFKSWDLVPPYTSNVTRLQINPMMCDVFLPHVTEKTTIYLERECCLSRSQPHTWEQGLILTTNTCDQHLQLSRG